MKQKWKRIHALFLAFCLLVASPRSACAGGGGRLHGLGGPSRPDADAGRRAPPTPRRARAGAADGRGDPQGLPQHVRRALPRRRRCP